ncbi:hypothetical protein V3C99_010254 [Haemonchus contortus]
MWRILLVAITVISFSDLRTEALFDEFYDSNALLTKPMKSFWHLNNRGRVLEKVFSELHLRRPQRAFKSAAPPPLPSEPSTAPNLQPCKCHYIYFTIHFCTGNCKSL